MVKCEGKCRGEMYIYVATTKKRVRRSEKVQLQAHESL